MNDPLVTIGVPVFRGVGLVEAALEDILGQTYPNLEVLISVDGGDEESARVCEPFLSDPRVRLTLQPDRLGWARNTNWLAQRRSGEFFVYQQQDDGLSADYIASLVEAAAIHPGASICYSAMIVESNGSQTRVEHRSVLGDALSRAFTHLERMDTSMFRGLIRSSALANASGIRSGDHESFGADLHFEAELAMQGEFRFVPGPIYYKRLHDRSTHLKWYDWPDAEKRLAWASLGARMLSALVRRERSHEERWHSFFAVLDRFATPRTGDRWIFCALPDDDAAGRLDIVNRVLDDALSNWVPELPAILETDAELLRKAATGYFGL